MTFFLITIHSIEKSYIYNPIFQIKNVVYNGKSDMIKDELKELSTSLYGKNIWGIDTESIEKIIKSDIRVKDVEVNFKNIGEIDFNIEEKKPAFYANIDNKSYVVDENGDIFASMNELKLEDLPLISVKKEENILDVIKILSKIKDESFLHMISQIFYESPVEINLLLDKGTMIRTNRDVSEKKYTVLRELYLDLSSNNKNKVEYIDLRYDGYIVKSIGVETGEKN